MRIRCDELSVRYPSTDGEIEAVAGLDLDVADGEFLSIVGPSGCGKSTLLRTLAGLLEPSGGTVERVSAADEGDRTLLVFQEQSLFPWMTVLENATFGLKMQGVGREERSAAARPLLERFGLGGRLGAYPHELSTGMKQRVAVIRAFISRPAALLMDEPFAALDWISKMTIERELLELWEADRKTVVFVTHNVDEAIRLSDRIVAMSPQPGRVVAEERVELARPRDAETVSSAEALALKRRVLEALGLGR